MSASLSKQDVSALYSLAHEHLGQNSTLTLKLQGAMGADEPPFVRSGLTYPDTLTDELKEVLGMPNFQCAPIAHGFRDAGLAEIPHKAEAEQAFIIDKLVRHVIAHGSDWRKHATAELEVVRTIIREKKDGWQS